MSESVASRRFYAFHLRVQKLSPHLRRDRPMAQLQRLAAHVWEAERQRAPLPHVVAGRGEHVSTWGCCSYCDVNWVPIQIVLARDNRNIGTLLHEIAHAMGSWDKLVHGPAFTARVFMLLEKYGKVDPQKLMAAALGHL